MNKSDFVIQQNEYRKEEHSFWETVFCITNGYIGVRNTLEFGSMFSKPGIFINDAYGFGVSVPNQILNIPNWLDNKIVIGNERINFDYVKVEDFRRELCMQSGCINTFIRFQHGNGRITELKREEFLFAPENNVYVEKINIMPVNYDDQFGLECLLNDSIGNAYHGGYLGETVKSYHWSMEKEEHSIDRLKACYKAYDSEYKLFIHSFFSFQDMDNIEWSEIHENRIIGNRYSGQLKQGSALTMVRVTCLTGGKRKALEDELLLLEKKLNFTDYDALYQLNCDVWKQRWSKVQFELEGNAAIKEGLTFSLFQMLQYSTSEHDVVNVPARGLSSYYHGGHFFFNTDLYLVPFYCSCNPRYSKRLIEYRIHTADRARQNAKELGYSGVFWSEESGIDGAPAGPLELIDFKAGVHFEEFTGRQVVHLACDVAYSIYYYIAYTGDKSFLTNEVLMVMVDGVRFYTDFLVHTKDNYYETCGIMGIDEYHNTINNSFYTMSMVKFLYGFCIQLVGEDEVLQNQLKIDKEEVEKWRDIQKHLKPANEVDSVFEQFDGYFSLAPVTINKLGENGLPYIDEDLRKELFYMESFDNQLIKQCDVVMFLSMFAKYYSKEQLRANYRYYDSKTMHESSLSPIHAGIIAYLVDEIEDGERYLKIASRYNLDFMPRKNYNNGIHVASYAGAWLIIFHGLFGMHIEDGVLCFEIHRGKQIEKLRCSYLYCGNELELNLTEEFFEVKLKKSVADNLNIRVNGNDYVLSQHDPIGKEYL